jgi:prevent-host-death family protein
MNIVRDIQSLSDFKKDASRIIKQIKTTKEPVVLTVNGKAAVVVQDAESYQALIEAKERTETVALLRERLKELEEGAEGVPLDEVFQNPANEHGIRLVD